MQKCQLVPFEMTGLPFNPFRGVFPMRLLGTWNGPLVKFHIDAAFGHLDAFGFEELSL